MMITNNTIAFLIKEKIHSVDPLAEVILFGSQARGEAKETSDWDILVLVEKPLSSRLDERKYRNAVFDLELEIERPISVMILSKKEWYNNYMFSSLFSSVKAEGIVL